MDSTLETTMVLTSNAGGILQSSADAKEPVRLSSRNESLTLRRLAKFSFRNAHTSPRIFADIVTCSPRY